MRRRSGQLTYTLYSLTYALAYLLRCVDAQDSVVATTPPYSNHDDHFRGARSFESGDTGSLMTLEDYAKSDAASSPLTLTLTTLTLTLMTLKDDAKSGL